MSDGGEENLKDSKRTESSKKSEVFVQFIAKVAVAQICGSQGFQGFQQSALDTLSDVAVRFIGQIGTAACLSANLAGRRECNVFDVIRGLEDLGSVQGFSGASDVHSCLMGSGMVKDIVRYVGEAEEIPFPFALPEFPVRKERKLNLSFVQRGEHPPREHIPEWLPVFPDPETYGDKKLRREKGDGKVERTNQVVEPRKVDRSALSSQHQLASNGPKAALTIDLGDMEKAKQPLESNLFFAPPLQFEEKEVSLVVRPAKLSEEAAVHHQNRIVESNNVSVLKTFAPVVEVINSTQYDTVEFRQRVISDRRPSVQFKLGSSRKISYTPIHDENEGFQSITSSWFRNNTEKDEKKRRAEEILKLSMENSEELVHQL